MDQDHLTVVLDMPFKAAIERASEAFRAHGFSVAPPLDLQGAFRERLGVPFRPYVLLRLHQEIEKVFEDFTKVAPMRWPGDGAGVDFKLDVSETDKEMRLTAELPGVDEKDIDITLSGDVLTIKGEKKMEEERKDEDYYVVERSYGAFARSLRLPYTVAEKDIDAKFADGVLTVVLPKPKEAQSETRKIAIKAHH